MPLGLKFIDWIWGEVLLNFRRLNANRMEP